MTTSSIVPRLRERCAALGMPQAELIRLAKIGDARWQQLRDGAPASTSEIERLARALAVNPGAVFAGEDQETPRSVTRFRSSGVISKPDVWPVLRSLSLAAEIGRTAGQLAQRLERQVPVVQARKVLPIRQKQTAEIGKSGYKLGANARKLLGVPDGPIRDLSSLLDTIGVHVARIDLGDGARGLDAASLWEAGAIPVVILNLGSDRVRGSVGAARATLAHELCHLLHDGGRQHLLTALSYGEGYGNYAEAVEIRARAFAPAFLAPSDQLRSWVKQEGLDAGPWTAANLRHVCEYWGLSREGAIYHLANSGILNEDPATAVQTLPSFAVNLDSFQSVLDPIAHTHTLDEVDVAPIWKGLAEQVVLDAHRRELISEGRARELLTWS